MTLYELKGVALDLLEQLESGDSDFSEECLRDTLESLEGEFADKVESYIVIIKELENDVERCKAEKKRLDERIKSAERNVLRLKNTITAAAIDLDMKNIKTDHYTVNRFNTQKLDIYGEVPEIYKREVQTIRKDVDKEAIKRALDSGKDLDFARYIKSCTIK